ncbi:hypothetical protein YC2023_038190 [Brassica napus]
MLAFSFESSFVDAYDVQGHRSHFTVHVCHVLRTPIASIDHMNVQLPVQVFKMRLRSNVYWNVTVVKPYSFVLRASPAQHHFFLQNEVKVNME